MRKVFTNSLPAAITSFLAIVAMVKFSYLSNINVTHLITENSAIANNVTSIADLSDISFIAKKQKK